MSARMTFKVSSHLIQTMAQTGIRIWPGWPLYWRVKSTTRSSLVVPQLRALFTTRCFMPRARQIKEIITIITSTALSTKFNQYIPKLTGVFPPLRVHFWLKVFGCKNMSGRGDKQRSTNQISFIGHFSRLVLLGTTTISLHTLCITGHMPESHTWY